MTIIGLSNNCITDAKEQLLYIYNGYRNSRPAQSNIFSSILRTYKGDMLDNANNLTRQREAIQSSLTEILSRYGYTDIDVTVEYIDGLTKFEVAIVVVDTNGDTIKLSDGLIFE